METTLIRRISTTNFRPIFSLYPFSTTLHSKFQTWIHFLKPPLTSSAVNRALTSQTDVDLAYDIFQWTSQLFKLSHHHPNMCRQSPSPPRRNASRTSSCWCLSLKCLLVDEAIWVFREMGLYGCEPNRLSFSYLVKGCFEKGRVWQGFEFFKEMREKEYVPTSSAYMVLVCSLTLERKFEDAIEVLHDMVGNGLKPDVLTYSTLLDEMCRDRRGVDAMEVLEEFRRKDASMGERTYKILLDNLHFVDH